MRTRSLLWSFNYAIEGIVYALRTQRNMRLHALAAAAVLFGALWFRISRLELLALMFAIAFVLIAELANTALEATIDLATEHYDPMAKTAKDVAAGAVLVAAVNAVAVGYVVFFDRLTDSAAVLLTRVRETPAHVTVIALGLTSLAVLVAKAMTRQGTFLSGGWPSGHTALAACGATAIAYLTMSPSASVLAAFLTALVAQSRVEAEVHTIPQVITGAAVGVLVTTLVFQVLISFS